MASIGRIYHVNCFLKHLLFLSSPSSQWRTGNVDFCIVKNACAQQRHQIWCENVCTIVCACVCVRNALRKKSHLFLNEFSVCIIFRSLLPRNIYICAILFANLFYSFAPMYNASDPFDIKGLPHFQKSISYSCILTVFNTIRSQQNKTKIHIKMFKLVSIGWQSINKKIIKK